MWPKRISRAPRSASRRPSRRNRNLLSAYTALAGIYVSQNRLDDAIKQYEAAIQKNPKFLAGYMTLGVIHEQKGNGDKAETYYRKVLDLNKDFAPAANNLAWNLSERGKNLDEALGFAQVAKEKMPKSAAVMDTLGWLYYLKGSYLNAVAELQESAAWNPKTRSSFITSEWPTSRALR